MLPKLLLVTSLLFSACTRYRVETRTITLPAEVCKVPAEPQPKGPVNPSKLEEPDGTVHYAMTETELRIVAIFITQLVMYNEMLRKCPGVEVDESLEIKRPEPVPASTRYVPPNPHGQT